MFKSIWPTQKGSLQTIVVYFILIHFGSVCALFNFVFLKKQKDFSSVGKEWQMIGMNWKLGKWEMIKMYFMQNYKNKT